MEREDVEEENDREEAGRRSRHPQSSSQRTSFRTSGGRARTNEKLETEGGQREVEEERGRGKGRGRTVRGGAELCDVVLACVSVSVCACM